VGGSAQVGEQRVADLVRLALRLREGQALVAVDDDPRRVGTLAHLRVEHVQHRALLDGKPRRVATQHGALPAQQLSHAVLRSAR